jgi:hypothetical protein
LHNKIGFLSESGLKVYVGGVVVVQLITLSTPTRVELSLWLGCDNLNGDLERDFSQQLPFYERSDGNCSFLHSSGDVGGDGQE